MHWPWQEQETIEKPMRTEAKQLMVRQEKSEQPDAVPTDLTLPRVRTHQDTMTQEQREFVLQNLAQFRSYYAIQQGMQERFGFTIGRQSIDHYAHAAKWRLYLRDARLKYLAKTMSVPIANQVVRMERYEQLFQESLFHRDRQGALAYLRAAAEEMGKINKQTGDSFYYTNQQIAFYDRTRCEQRLSEMQQEAQHQGVMDGAPARLSETGTAVPISQ